MNTYTLHQFLKELSSDRPADNYDELSVYEQLLVGCYRKLDARDRKDLLCFLFEKISH